MGLATFENKFQEELLKVTTYYLTTWPMLDAPSDQTKCFSIIEFGLFMEVSLAQAKGYKL